jgi:isopenicillin N synthase-like dioxygenase
MNFPVLDFSKFTDGDDSQRGECARKLVQQFEQHGFATFCNHGLSNDQVEDLFKWVFSSQSGELDVPSPNI